MNNKTTIAQFQDRVYSVGGGSLYIEYTEGETGEREVFNIPMPPGATASLSIAAPALPLPTPQRLTRWQWIRALLAMDVSDVWALIVSTWRNR